MRPQHSRAIESLFVFLPYRFKSEYFASATPRARAATFAAVCPRGFTHRPATTPPRAPPLARQPILHHAVPRPLDQLRLARRTHRIRAIAINIALIHVMEPRIERDPPRPVQRLRRRPRLILQFEIRMKRRKVQRHIWPQILENPF